MIQKWEWCPGCSCWETKVEDIIVKSDSCFDVLNAYEWRKKIIKRDDGTEYITIAAREGREWIYLGRWIMGAITGDEVMRIDVSGMEYNIFDARFINLKFYPAGRTLKQRRKHG